jgi:hypothetical protein
MSEKIKLQHLQRKAHSSIVKLPSPQQSGEPEIAVCNAGAFAAIGLT